MKYIIASLVFIVVLVVYLRMDNQADYKYVAPLPWMEKQINKDLQLYVQKGISSSMLETAREAITAGKLPGVVLITITDKGIEAFPQNKSKRVEMVVKRIERIKKQGGKIPDVSFLLGNHDHWNLMDRVPHQLRSQLPPIFVFAASRKDPFRNYLVLFPDDHTLGDHLIGYRRGWHAISKEILNNISSHPWEQKQNIAFWRGLDTDTSEYDKPAESPRSKLVSLAKRYPQLIDAQFTHTSIANSFVVKNLRPVMQLLSIPPYISQAKQLQYKILLNLDGHTSTYPGFLWRLLSGCVTLKQETDNEQWFYSITKPMVHYVPMEEQLGDIIPKIEWILTHDSEAKKIAEQASNLVKENLMMEHIDAYIVLLLERYHELLHK
jgi:hypothetical protein